VATGVIVGPRIPDDLQRTADDQAWSVLDRGGRLDVMRQTRGILVTTGLLLVLVGAAGLLAPEPFHRSSGLEVGTDAGLLSELRGAYGALLAIGAVVTAGAFVEWLTTAAALTGAALYLGYGLARLLSLAADGRPPTALLLITVLELACGTACAIVVRRQRTSVSSRG
jgi:hypothetical protein